MFRPPRKPDEPARPPKKKRKVYHCFCGAEIEITRDYIGRVSARCNSCLRPWRDNPLPPLPYPLPMPEPEVVEAPRGRGREVVVLPFRKPRKEGP